MSQRKAHTGKSLNVWGKGNDNKHHTNPNPMSDHTEEIVLGMRGLQGQRRPIGK